MDQYTVKLEALKQDQKYRKMSAPRQMSVYLDMLQTELMKTPDFQQASPVAKELILEDFIKTDYQPTYTNPAFKMELDQIKNAYRAGDQRARQFMIDYTKKTDYISKLPWAAQADATNSYPTFGTKLPVANEYADSAVQSNRIKGADDDKAREEILSLFREYGDDQAVDATYDIGLNRRAVLANIGEEVVSTVIVALLTGGVGAGVKAAQLAAKAGAAGAKIAGQAGAKAAAWAARKAPEILIEGGIEGLRGMAQQIMGEINAGEKPSVLGAAKAFGAHAAIDLTMSYVGAALLSKVGRQKRLFKEAGEHLDATKGAVNVMKTGDIPAGFSRPHYLHEASTRAYWDTNEKLLQDPNYLDTADPVIRANYDAFESGHRLTQNPDGSFLVMRAGFPNGKANLTRVKEKGKWVERVNLTDKPRVFKNLQEFNDWVGDQQWEFINKLMKSGEKTLQEEGLSYMARHPGYKYGLFRELAHRGYDAPKPTKTFISPRNRQYVNDVEAKGMTSKTKARPVYFSVTVPEELAKSGKVVWKRGDTLDIIQDPAGNAIVHVSAVASMRDWKTALDVARAKIDKDGLKVFPEALARDELIKAGYDAVNFGRGRAKLLFADNIKIIDNHINPSTGKWNTKVEFAKPATAPKLAPAQVVETMAKNPEAPKSVEAAAKIPESKKPVETPIKKAQVEMALQVQEIKKSEVNTTKWAFDEVMSSPEGYRDVQNWVDYVAMRNPKIYQPMHRVGEEWVIQTIATTGDIATHRFPTMQKALYATLAMDRTPKQVAEDLAKHGYELKTLDDLAGYTKEEKTAMRLGVRTLEESREAISRRNLALSKTNQPTVEEIEDIPREFSWGLGVINKNQDMDAFIAAYPDRMGPPFGDPNSPFIKVGEKGDYDFANNRWRTRVDGKSLGPGRGFRSYKNITAMGGEAPMPNQLIGGVRLNATRIGVEPAKSMDPNDALGYEVVTKLDKEIGTVVDRAYTGRNLWQVYDDLGVQPSVSIDAQPAFAYRGEVPEMTLVMTEEIYMAPVETATKVQAMFVPNDPPVEKVISEKPDGRKITKSTKTRKPKYIVEIPEAKHTRVFDDAAKAQAYMNKTWYETKDLYEMAKAKGLDMTFEKGRWKVFHKDHTFTSATRKEAIAELAKIPTPKGAREVFPDDLLEALDQVGYELELPPGFLNMERSLSNSWPRLQGEKLAKSNPTFGNVMMPKKQAIRRMIREVDAEDKTGLWAAYEAWLRDMNFSNNKTWQDQQEISKIFTGYGKKDEARNGILHYLEAANPEEQAKVKTEFKLSDQDLAVSNNLREFYKKKAAEVGINYEQYITFYQPRLRSFVKSHNVADIGDVTTLELMKTKDPILHRYMMENPFVGRAHMERTLDAMRYGREEDAMTVALRYVSAENRHFYANDSTAEVFRILNENFDRLANSDNGLLKATLELRENFHNPSAAFHMEAVSKSLRKLFSKHMSSETSDALVRTLIGLPGLVNMTARFWLPFRNLFQVANVLPLRTGRVNFKAMTKMIKPSDFRNTMAEMIEKGILQKPAHQTAEYLDMISGAYDNNAPKLFQLMQKGMYLYAKSDDWTRGVAYHASNEVFDRALAKSMAGGKLDIDTLVKRTFVDVLDPIQEKSFRDLALAGNIEGAKNLLARYNIDFTMFDYSIPNKPIAANSAFGQVFYQMGTFSINYLQALGTTFKPGRGSMANKLKIALALGAGTASTAIAMKEAGVDNSSFLPWRMASFTGGPWVDIFKDVSSIAAPGIEGQLARSSLGRTFSPVKIQDGKAVLRYPYIMPGALHARYFKKGVQYLQDRDIWKAWLAFTTTPEYRE